MITPDELVGEKSAEWYRLTPLERWRESEKLGQIYLDLGGSLDAEFHDPNTPGYAPS